MNIKFFTITCFVIQVILKVRFYIKKEKQLQFKVLASTFFLHNILKSLFVFEFLLF